LTPVVFVIAVVFFSVLAYPHGSQMFDLYRPGTLSQVAVADGVLGWKLNGHVFQRPVVSVVKIRHFGDLSVIAFSDGSVVLPTAFVPHRTVPGAGPELNKRWGRPAN